MSALAIAVLVFIGAFIGLLVGLVVGVPMGVLLVTGAAALDSVGAEGRES